MASAMMMNRMTSTTMTAMSTVMLASGGAAAEKGVSSGCFYIIQVASSLGSIGFEFVFKEEKERFCQYDTFGIITPNTNYYNRNISRVQCTTSYSVRVE